MSKVDFDGFPDLSQILETWEAMANGGRLSIEGSVPSLDEDKLYPEGQRRLTGRALTDHVAKTTTDVIWKAGRFRFFERGVQQEGDGSLTYQYTCAQDKNQPVKGSAMDLDVHKKMPRFGCGGRLTITVPMDHKNIKINLQHDWHKNYTDCRRQVELEEFVKFRAADHSAEEIRRLMRISQYFAALEVTQAEVIAAWEKAKAEEPKDLADQLAKVKLDTESAMAAQLTRLEQPGIYDPLPGEECLDVAWCPACGTTHAIFEFHKLSSGLHELQCGRHEPSMQPPTTQPRTGRVIRRFDKFCTEIWNWNYPNQSTPLSIKCVVPVSQVSWAFSIGEYGRPVQEIYDRAATLLMTQIQGCSGYHFGLVNQHLYPDERRKFWFKCIQDQTYTARDDVERKTLCHDVTRHACASTLAIEFSKGFETVTITLDHNYHQSDFDSGLDSEIIGFIWARAFRCFPVQIHGIITAFPYPITPGDENVLLEQVTYEWERAVMKGPAGVDQVPKGEDSVRFFAFAKELLENVRGVSEEDVYEALFGDDY